MAKLKRAVLWCALALMVLLTVLSVYGAFLGAERARESFNSMAAGVYWSALGAGLILGLFLFRRLIRVPALLLMHFGCILILLGSGWGSGAGHRLQAKVFGIEKIRKGRMIILEGETANEVALENAAVIKRLPFSLRLKDFRVEHYEPEYLDIESQQGPSWRIPVEIGSEFSLGEGFGTVRIVEAFENFKITFEEGKSVALDDPQPGYNPALEVQIRHANGDVRTQYVFERFAGHVHPEDKFQFYYRRVISDYISEVEVIKEDKVAAEKDIEVNHPLHFGGYHFYQQDYDDEGHRYTILQVVSDSGLNLVYVGYVILCIGVFQHLWLREIRSERRELRSE
ncbi:MAG: cytochrome c biogenesis protein ResB [Planctomycetota bacterium]|jgi:cytochrome c biogenesis protein ResB